MSGVRAAVVAVWRRVHEPRFVSFAYFVQYLILAAVGAYAVKSPPTSISGEIGERAMVALAMLLTAGGVIGAVAVLPGKYWLERFAVAATAAAGVIYVVIVLALHQMSEGNRLLQAGIIACFLIHQGVRWYRIKDRPFRPAPHVVEA